ncbi:MAG: glycosyltransferase family 2 protein [Deltaproteobacteria bacterium]|nr:glycosyltransferase family 2 protein [Deltaproteobacteria bacterium]
MSNLSAIIVNYNAGPVLNEAVNSLLDSASVTKVIVVDNASTDHSMEEMERLAVSQPRLMCIRNNKNLGFAKACNIGIAADGESDYLLSLNPDCIVDSGALEKLLTCMESLPQTGMAGPLLLNPDGTEQAGGRRAVPTPWRSFIRVFGLSKFSNRYPRLFSDFLLHQQPLPDGPMEMEAISGSCMLVRRDAMLEVGLFDEGYFLHCEDLDWCMRFRRTCWKIMFVPDARVVHQKGVCSKNRPIFVAWHKHKGMMRFYGKFFRHQYPGVLLWIVGFGVWLRFGTVILRYSVKSLKQWLNHDRF